MKLEQVGSINNCVRNARVKFATLDLKLTIQYAVGPEICLKLLVLINYSSIQKHVRHTFNVDVTNVTHFKKSN